MTNRGKRARSPPSTKLRWPSSRVNKPERIGVDEWPSLSISFGAQLFGRQHQRQDYSAVMPRRLPVELSRFAESFLHVCRPFPRFADFGDSRRVVGLCQNYANNSSRNWFCAVARPEHRKLMSAVFIN